MGRMFLLRTHRCILLHQQRAGTRSVQIKERQLSLYRIPVPTIRGVLVVRREGSVVSFIIFEITRFCYSSSKVIVHYVLTIMH